MEIRLLPAFLMAASAAVALAQSSAPASVFGYRDFSKEAKVEEKFLAVPDAKLAGEELKTLTAEPHLASTPEDRKTADYVAQKFRAAGLETEIVPYRVLMNQPKTVKVEAFGADGKVLMTGPHREHVAGDPFDENARVVMPFNGSSGSGDVTGDVVYANYGRLEDFDQLAADHIDLHGKIVITRYGANFRGVKVYIAEQRGAAGVLIYSDPQDDGYFKGDAYPQGPWRPESGVQRGSVQYLFKYPGDPETPGVASTPELPDGSRINPEGNQPHIIAIPISYADAAPILQALKGPGVPQGWQGALPFRYHMGGLGTVKAHLVSEQDYQRRTIWDVIGTVKGTDDSDDEVLVGNHRDAWVYGAVDPNSGTAAMLEAVHGVGALIKDGWKPRRTIVFCSWDAEEEGLIGSTEWVEQHAQALQHAVAYFNVDVAVSGPNFSAAAVPSLKQFVREIARSVPSPTGGSVYDAWRSERGEGNEHRPSNAPPDAEVRVGDLGSGSDFTPFLQHVGVPSTDIGSGGPYGVYHSVFDNYAWFTMNADPHFVYLQEMARVLGLEAVRMADTEVLPYDYVPYAREITSYLETAKKKAGEEKLGSVDFGPALAAAGRFTAAAEHATGVEKAAGANAAAMNQALREAETDFVSPAGLPNRPWYRHTIYAPGEYTGYAAVVIPGVTEAIQGKNAERASQQLGVLTEALERAAHTLGAVQSGQ
ncbi:M28 family peptidase [Acidobacteria bacterium AB60]|nr:M28 family peptidase [Acidobacteria bacterium AB60]